MCNNLQFIKKALLISGSCSFTIDILLLIFFIHDIYFPTSFAVSSAFDPQAFSDQRSDSIQTIGNEIANLKSDHVDLLERYRIIVSKGT
jgi:hypothetical protein